jgi:protein MBA1
VTIFCRRKSARNSEAKPNISATITTIASLCRARGQQQQHFTMALSLRHTPGFTRQINRTASRIYAANSSSSQPLQHQQRWFSQSLAPQAKGVQEFMPVKRPLEKSLKIRAKEMSLDSMPTDLGLLPGTFIRPEGKNMPSIFRQPGDRLRMEWVWLKQWFQNVAGYVSFLYIFYNYIDSR